MKVRCFQWLKGFLFFYKPFSAIIYKSTEFVYGKLVLILLHIQYLKCNYITNYFLNQKFTERNVMYDIYTMSSCSKAHFGQFTIGKTDTAHLHFKYKVACKFYSNIESCTMMTVPSVFMFEKIRLNDSK